MLIHPTAARSVSTRTVRKGQRQAVLRSTRRDVAALADDLRALDARIAGIVEGLPTQAATFDSLAELADGLRCVQSDLLSDAIETLDALSSRNDTELRRRCAERRAWRLAEGE